jgi:hypothetical protein
VELAEPACLDTANPHLNDPWNCERRFVEFVREAGRGCGGCRALAEPLAEPAGRQRRGIAPQRRAGNWGVGLGVRNGEELGVAGRSWERMGVGNGWELGTDGSWGADGSGERTGVGSGREWGADGSGRSRNDKKESLPLHLGSLNLGFLPAGGRLITQSSAPIECIKS